MKKFLLVVLCAGLSGFALGADAVTVTTLDEIPGKRCQLHGDFPGVSHSEIRYAAGRNPVSRAVADAIQGIRDLAREQGANAVLDIDVQIVALPRKGGTLPEFGDVIVTGSLARCE